MPVLVLGGEEGLAMVPYEQLRQLADDVTGGVVAGVGHFVVEVRPNELLAILGPFLR